MKMFVAGVLVIFCGLSAHAGNIVVERVRGDVTVRHGVMETWVVVKAGELLRPDDSMKTGPGGSAVIATREMDGQVRKRISLPSEVIVDMSDVRELTQEELMLKLAMERVRSAPSGSMEPGDLNAPNTTTIHGTDQTPGGLVEGKAVVGVLQMNGTKVLFQNGFYPTCALRAMDVLRRYPVLRRTFEYRMLVGEALAKADLTGEALNEFVALSAEPTLTAGQKAAVHDWIQTLRTMVGN